MLHILAEGASGSSSTVFAILGSLGGITAFCVAVYAIIKSIMKQVTATDANTKATEANTQAIEELRKSQGELRETVNIQAERISGQGREIGDLRRAVFNGGQHRN